MTGPRAEGVSVAPDLAVAELAVALCPRSRRVVSTAARSPDEGLA